MPGRRSFGASVLVCESSAGLTPTRARRPEAGWPSRTFPVGLSQKPSRGCRRQSLGMGKITPVSDVRATIEKRLKGEW